MEPRVTDVEVLKKKARKMAASQVLAGGGADIGLPLGEVQGCQVRIAAGYGSLSEEPAALPADRLIWILDGFVDVTSASGQVTRVSQGECTVLPAGRAHRLAFPTLTLYLCVEAEGTGA
jgi:quercetin dioxygenase-like cupin family protein